MNALLDRSDMARDSKAARGSHSLPATHSLTIHSCLYSPAAQHHRPFAGTHRAYSRRDGQAELTWVTGYTEIDFPAPGVEHQTRSPIPCSTCTNRTRCRVILLGLPLSQTADSM